MAWHLLRSGGENEEFGFAHKEFLIDFTSDISTEPTEYGPIAMGSMAHTAGYANMYEKGADNAWHEI